MKLSALEQQVVSNMDNLPLDKQQVILELSAFLKNKSQANQLKKTSEPFGEQLKKFLEEVKSDPVDIDTSSVMVTGKRSQLGISNAKTDLPRPYV